MVNVKGLVMRIQIQQKPYVDVLKDGMEMIAQKRYAYYFYFYFILIATVIALN